MMPPLGIDHPAAQSSGDGWDEFIRSANRLTVTSIGNFRATLTFKDRGVLPELRAMLDEMKSSALSDLDSSIVRINPPFLLSQDDHDAMYAENWRKAEALVDQIFEECFFPQVRSWPLEMPLNGGPDVQLSASIDLPSGYRRLTYVMRKSDSFERTVTVLPTLTLDTNVVTELWERQSKQEFVQRLIDTAKMESISMRVTGRIDEDVPRLPRAEKIADLPDSGIDLMSAIIRLRHWRVGEDKLDSMRFAEVYAALTDQQGRDLDRDWKDWDHLHAHFVNKRDVFLTWDQKLLGYGPALESNLGLLVMRPEDFLANVDAAVTRCVG